MEGAKVTAGVRKPKKKQVKDELDRIKQAEKKRRRLEKALANSAAIRSELEKKKQRKKEEQERLDKEGAAIAEAAALHVLIGEDSDDSGKFTLNKDERLSSWDRFGNIGTIVGRRQPLMVPHQNLPKHSLENIGLTVCDGYIFGQPWNHWGNSNSMVSADDHVNRGLYPQSLLHEGWGSIGLSADHIVARGVSSLSIADDARRDAYMFNHMLRG